MNRKVLKVVLCTLSFVVIDAGGPTVRTEISNGVVRTGIGQYGTYLLPNLSNFVNVSCTTSMLPQDAEIILLVNDSELGLPAVAIADRINKAVFLFRIISTEVIQFTCRLQIITAPDQNRGSFKYVADDCVELNVWPLSGRPRCVSSIGSSGTKGETTMLTCTTSVDSRETEIRWRDLEEDIQMSNGPLLATIRTLNVSQVVNGLVCQKRENGEQWMEACTFPPLTVLQENNIAIRPMLFSPDVSRLTFTCETRPPGRIEWLVLGDYGNIADRLFSNGFLPRSEFNFKVRQKVGTSTLDMSDPSLSLYGIHTVMCTSSERRYFRIAISQAQDSDNPTDPTIPPDVSNVTTTTMTCNNEGKKESFANIIVIVVSLALLVLS